jgi:sec-independent protein translocase protein TatA
MFGLGPMELVVILTIVVIIFGVGKLPEIGTGLGEGIKNFKKSYRDAKALDVTEKSNSSETKVESEVKK